MNEEIWKSIPGYPDYEISSLGRIRSWKGHRGIGRAKTPKILSTPPDNESYQQIVLCSNGNIIHTRVHRLVMLAFVGPCPEGMEVCHNDGNRANSQLDNLRYDTHINNILDCRLQGKMGKFTKNQIEQIRLEVQNNYSWDLTKKLAEKYKDNHITIARVATSGYDLANIPPIKIRTLRNKRAEKVRFEYANGDISQDELGKKYNLTKSAVSKIINGVRGRDAVGPIKGKDY